MMRASLRWALLSVLAFSTMAAQAQDAGLVTAKEEGAAAELPVVTTEPFKRSEQRQSCSNYTPTRRPFFGDTHVHTAWSFDASAQDTRNTPNDAYAFARGGSMRIQPYDDNGVGGTLLLRKITLW